MASFDSAANDIIVGHPELDSGSLQYGMQVRTKMLNQVQHDPQDGYMSISNGNSTGIGVLDMTAGASAMSATLSLLA